MIRARQRAPKMAVLAGVALRVRPRRTSRSARAAASYRADLLERLPAAPAAPRAGVSSSRASARARSPECLGGSACAVRWQARGPPVRRPAWRRAPCPSKVSVSRRRTPPSGDERRPSTVDRGRRRHGGSSGLRATRNVERGEPSTRMVFTLSSIRPRGTARGRPHRFAVMATIPWSCSGGHRRVIAGGSNRRARHLHVIRMTS